MEEYHLWYQMRPTEKTIDSTIAATQMPNSSSRPTLWSMQPDNLHSFLSRWNSASTKQSLTKSANWMMPTGTMCASWWPNRCDLKAKKSEMNTAKHRIESSTATKEMTGSSHSGGGEGGGGGDGGGAGGVVGLGGGGEGATTARIETVGGSTLSTVTPAARDRVEALLARCCTEATTPSASPTT